MPAEYTSSLVLLSYIVAVTASHVTLLLAGRVRDPKSSGWRFWVVGGALAMGAGIWSMHFVAMLALRLPIQVVYDLPLTILSCLFGVLASGLALWTLRTLRAGIRDILIPGVLIGVGIAAMHYTGMAAMKLNPAIRYDPLLFVLSVGVAIAVAMTALWIVFRVDSLRERRVVAQFAAALILGAAIVGMHFTGMAATSFDPGSICLASGPRINETWMAVTIGAFSVLLLAGTMLLSLYDARLSSAIARSAERLQRANEELEARVAERTRNLASEEARKDAILRGALDCIVSMDSQGRIVEFNPAAETTFGYKREEVLGRMLVDIIIPEEARESHSAEITRFLATGTGNLVGHRVEIAAQRRSGEEFPAELAITVVKVEREYIFTAYLRDITERKRIDQSLRSAIEAAQSASQAKSAFVATMSHEIRTPMNAVIGLLELLSLTELSEDQRDTLATVQESSRSLLGLIDDILDFSKIEAGKLEISREPCSVAQLVDGVVAIFKAVASGKGLLLHHHIDPNLWPAHLVDGTRLRQILNNVVSNAVKFTRTGTVTLEVNVLQTTENEQLLRFGVRDTGIGMDGATLERLFQPFEQGESNTNRRFGGTGLGLAISRRIAELMGGAIQVHSALELGTRVSLTVRFEKAAVPAIVGTDAVVGGAATIAGLTPLIADADQRRRLLIVDDHPTNLRMLKRQLKVLGLEADTAGGGKEALEKWRKEKHDIIITDCQMPEMDGYALTRAIRSEQEAGSHPTVIAFTANSHREALEQCRRAEMDDYLTKPAQLASLHAKLTQWLRSTVSPCIAASNCDSASQPPDEEQLFDAGYIEEVAGSPEHAVEVLGEFRAAALADIAALRARLSENDTQEVGRVAHRVKGAASMIGAHRLALVAGEVEQSARMQLSDQLGPTTESLVHELERVLAAIGQVEDAGAVRQ